MHFNSIISELSFSWNITKIGSSTRIRSGYNQRLFLFLITNLNTIFLIDLYFLILVIAFISYDFKLALNIRLEINEN